jgi:hypothetical protein
MLGWLGRPRLRDLAWILGYWLSAPLVARESLERANDHERTVVAGEHAGHRLRAALEHGVLQRSCDHTPQLVGGVCLRTRTPAPAASTRAALSGWSRPSGMHSSGTPSARAALIVCQPA